MMIDDQQAKTSASIPQWADLGDVSLKFIDTGGQGGRPLLLLHEMGGTLDSWDLVLTHLPVGRRVIRCDMRGAGGSEKIREPMSMDGFTNDVVALLDYLDLTGAVDVAGIAIGGCIALRIAALYPKRVHRLMSINPPTDCVGRSGEVLRERAQITDEQGMRGVVEGALARSYPDVLRGDSAAYEAYAARFICNDSTSYAHILRALSEVDFEALFAKVQCPTLFVAGRHDLVRLPEVTQAVSRRVKGADFQEIEGGHIPSVQAPRAVAQALIGFFEIG